MFYNTSKCDPSYLTYEEKQCLFSFSFLFLYVTKQHLQINHWFKKNKRHGLNPFAVIQETHVKYNV